MSLDSIESAIAAIAAGELVIVVDDTDRENEGDLIMAAAKITPERMAFMIRHTSGIICVPMAADRAEALNLQPMVANNRDPMRTAFTVTVDYKVGLTTGISAEERSQTVRALANDNCQASDFLRPGHVFPLISREGGVLARSGHTEAATDLAALAGLARVGVLAEVVNDDGTVKRLPELVAFAAEHDLRIISIEDIIQYRSRKDTLVRQVDRFAATVRGHEVTVTVFDTPLDALQHVAIGFGTVNDGAPVPCRIHRENTLADLLDGPETSQKWLGMAFDRFARQGRGVFVLIRNPAARSDGEAEGGKGAAADMSGEKHLSARQRNARWREVGIGAQILRSLGVRTISLLSTHEHQFVGLAGFGITIAGTEILADF